MDKIKKFENFDNSTKHVAQEILNNLQEVKNKIFGNWNIPIEVLQKLNLASELVILLENGKKSITDEEISEMIEKIRNY